MSEWIKEWRKEIYKVSIKLSIEAPYFLINKLNLKYFIESLLHRCSSNSLSEDLSEQGSGSVQLKLTQNKGLSSVQTPVFLKIKFSDSVHIRYKQPTFIAFVLVSGLVGYPCQNDFQK